MGGGIGAKGPGDADDIGEPRKEFSIELGVGERRCAEGLGGGDINVLLPLLPPPFP